MAGASVAVFGLVFAAAFVLTAVPWLIVFVSVPLGLILSALTVVDIRTYRLPDLLTLPLIALGLAATALIDPAALPWHAVATAMGYGLLAGVAALYRWLRGRDGLGLGDAKLLAAGGAWLGPAGLPSMLALAAVSALAVVAVARLAGRRFTADEAIPFGPFLAMGLWAVWLFGPIG
jgi:leader peptidase (prepilin peptidase)/N-methyltransferase